MNRHSKLALLLAPFLILGGFVLSDLYLEHQASENRIIELVPFGHCDVKNQHCELKSGEFEVNIMDEGGITTVNSTYPLDTATLFLVNKQNQASHYQLGMKDNPYYWRRETPLGSYIANKGDSYKLRLILEIKGGKYIAEFYTQTTR
ncbi:hypothetical protein tinsulaeT_16570 [Thalassotalea insulae]|uniref:Uncharacterized protein n=1 Tax=Thalassotalea insulae TaxID=2056778 RepID=A0ABQ6GUI2_9GAMM|nr:hypothetical protein [Thalassotalea insulae]GLX78317.1 hypothetical protein tinsulaeT_16570 [Thalassotalea insulae]